MEFTKNFYSAKVRNSFLRKNKSAKILMIGKHDFMKGGFERGIQICKPADKK